MKLEPKYLSVSVDEESGNLYATALAWVIGKFDKESRSWVEFDKPEFIELDNDLTLAPEEMIEEITDGILPSPKDFQRWIEEN